MELATATSVSVEMDSHSTKTGITALVRAWQSVGQRKQCPSVVCPKWLRPNRLCVLIVSVSCVVICVLIGFLVLMMMELLARSRCLCESY